MFVGTEPVAELILEDVESPQIEINQSFDDKPETSDEFYETESFIEKPQPDDTLDAFSDIETNQDDEESFADPEPDALAKPTFSMYDDILIFLTCNIRYQNFLKEEAKVML